MNNNKIETLINNLCNKYDDCDFSSLALKGDGFPYNEIEITCIPRFVNDYEVNYYEDNSQIYDFIEDFKDNFDIDTKIYIIEPMNDEDYFVAHITW